MNKEEVRSLIERIVNRLAAQKGVEQVKIDDATRFLGGNLPIDSLDLAVIVTELERTTKKDPFKSGFKNFRTVGELAELYVG